MTRLAYAVAAVLALAAPVAADSLTTMLPSLTFPTDPQTTLTKVCAGSAIGEVCQLAE